jgi:hypothetical protein
MAEESAVTAADGRNAESAEAKGRNKDEVALELMKFIAVSTGYGKASGGGAGFSGKPTHSPEEYADVLLQLFERCRTVVAKEPQK